jgi:hypothetical protein
MTKGGLLNSVEALEVLGLWNPADGTKPNVMYLKWLADRGLLPRIKLGHRKIVYKKADCERLLERAAEQGIPLTTNPNNDNT